MSVFLRKNVSKVFYNSGHNFLGLYNILVEIRLTQVKRNLISCVVNLVYELPHELPNDLILRKLGNIIKLSNLGGHIA